MKTLNLLLFCLLIFNTSCNNDDYQSQNPIDLLPPATKTGEQTFGCLINGDAFIPDKFGSGRPNAFYQFVDGKYTLGISAIMSRDNNFQTVILGGLDIDNLQEIDYQLLDYVSGNFYGIYDKRTGSTSNPVTLTTLNNRHGNLTITNFDPNNYIISGTFEFTVLDKNDNEIKITDGRFDLLYTN